MRILITGAGGMLGAELTRSVAEGGHTVLPYTRSALDVTDDTRVRAHVCEDRPDVVIHCAAYTAVDQAEADEPEALRVNATGTRAVARAAAEVGARVVYISSDYVFDGRSGRPYRPSDAPAPINVYGRTKLAGERAVRDCDALIVRTSWLFGAGGRNFVTTILDRARAGEPLRVVDDQTGSPTWTRDLARMILLLVEARVAPGVYHATNSGQASWFEFAGGVLALAGVDAVLEPIPTRATQRPAARPAYSVLDCSATYALTGAARPWRDALAAAIAEGLGQVGAGEPGAVPDGTGALAREPGAPPAGDAAEGTA